MSKYSPRRASKRWLEGAPSYILDCFDSKGCGERYTVFFGKPFTYHLDRKEGVCKEGSDTSANTYVQFLGMSGAPSHPQGVSMWGEMEAHNTAAYRYRQKHRRVKWLDLPEEIRKHVIARAES